MQNEIIKNCLIQEYSVGGCPEMGELLAAANGVEQEYGELLTAIKVCCNAIFLAIYSTEYFSRSAGAYNEFAIIIGQKENKQVYCTDVDFMLPYAVRSWISGEPLQLYFVQFYQFHCGSLFHYRAEQHRKDLASLQFQIATKLKNFLKKCFAQRKSEWIISLQINHVLGETIISKLA